MVPPTSALAPLRVLDFSRVLACPFATMLLADLGAEVTKVERPDIGDDTRAWGPPYDDRGTATCFLAVNRNKTGMVLDLADPDDLSTARRLAGAADVVVENFRPGVMDRLGLGYDALRADNPGLVYCSITGFGRSAGADLPGYDLPVQAGGGLMSITGVPDAELQKVGVAVVDVLAGLFATVGILAAVRHRDTTGKGQRVEVDLLSSLLAGLVNQASAYTAGGVVPSRMATGTPASSRTSRFRPARANSSSPSPTIASSAHCAPSSGPSLSPPIPGSPPTPPASPTATSCAQCLSNFSLPAPRRSGPGHARPPGCPRGCSTTSQAPSGWLPNSVWSPWSRSPARMGQPSTFRATPSGFP
jgi:hypothetical protein